MNTEQALIAMIKDPGKKFTDGCHIASYENGDIAVRRGHSGTGWNLSGFLNGFSCTTWTEHKEPRTFTETVEVAFYPTGGSVIEPVLSIPDIVRIHADPLNDTKWRAEIKVTEVL